MQPYPYFSSTALITGASRGIGAAIAHLLAERGTRTLILTARAKDDLEALAAELFAAHGTRVEIITADLADSDAPASIKQETDRRGLHVDLLINNAGFGTHGLFDQTDAGKSRDMVEVNIQALVALTHLYLPEMIAKNQGGIVNIASTAAFQPVPYMAAYAASKAFVLTFSEALAVEVSERGAGGVRVIALCPGGTATNFGDGMLRGHFEQVRQHTPEQVAEATLHALDQNDAVAVVGAMNYAMTLSSRFFPRDMVAKVSASIFRPDNLPAPAQPKSKPPTQTRLLILATTAGLAGLTVAALLMRRSRN